MWENIGVGLFYIIAGILVKKFPILLAGYNTMSDKEKAKINIKRLTNFIMITYIIIGLIIMCSYFIFCNLLNKPELNSTFIHVCIPISFVILLIGSPFYGKNC